MKRRDVLQAGAAAAIGNILPGYGAAKPAKSAGKLHSFRPGALWLDTAGKPIQAHGGSIIQVGELFYWYGENKERTDGVNGIWHWGVRCYSSADLYNWDDLGVIIQPRPDDPSSPLYPTKGMDRPHILFNAASQKFVCWLKIMEDRKSNQTRAVFVADQMTGPWKEVARGLHPEGMNAGDFDIAVNAVDGKAYMYFERVHSELICADLTPDYTGFSGYYSTHFPRPGPPQTREGPAYFKRGSQHYLVTSGTTGYMPNASEIAMADTFHGPWTILGDLHPGDGDHVSFNSQISCIFKVPGKKDLYIAMADRWVAGISSETYRLALGAYAKIRGPASGRPALSRGEIAAIGAVDMNKLNTSLARYVWLPIEFQEDRPVINWRDEWSINDYM